ncbi:hypothetical protein B0T24DRAFT_290931 [Lasiosphaeria ovina]|uniref:Zn(2)-C6 fungal-type domain-containing protein n=1 Tax=Lasiosphaeria ovina TaxID=92902 RepID=A0AAE0KDN5_9PEZI|nr:hypothetical protein B0T24DRAFT_290931 [Lasiosphaeria ovina]
MPPISSRTRSDRFLIGGPSQLLMAKPGPQSFVFTLDHRPRATRASVPKVRSGCITCKKRHVKCDEAKPSCQRCLKWQGVCEGYNPLDSRAPTRSSSPVSTPAEAAGSPSSSQSPSDSPAFSTEVPYESDANIGTVEWESLYFDNWSFLSSNLGGGWFHVNLFSRTVPQLSQSEPAIRYAAIAIGALAAAVAPNTLPTPMAALQGDASHYKLALTYYGRALRLVRDHQDQNSESTLRIAVIACMLFACFETLHDSCESAINHINHGLMIIEQFIRGQNTITGDINNLGHPRGALLGYVERREGSDNLFILEDEILQVFQRLDYLSWSTGLISGWRQTSRISIQAAASPSYRDMPDRFSNLDEARRRWDAVQHWTLQFPRAVVAPIAASLSSSSPATDDDTVAFLGSHVILGLEEMQRAHLGTLEQWSAAFWPVFSAAEANKAVDPLSYHQAVSILLQYILSLVCVRSVCFGDSAALQEMTDAFRDIVRLAEIMVSNQPKGPGSAKVFTMDNGPTLALFVAATKCTHLGVRADAVALLDRYPRRDAFWDTTTVMNLATAAANFTCNQN